MWSGRLKLILIGAPSAAASATLHCNLGTRAENALDKGDSAPPPTSAAADLLSARPIAGDDVAKQLRIGPIETSCGVRLRLFAASERAAR